MFQNEKRVSLRTPSKKKEEVEPEHVEKKDDELAKPADKLSVVPAIKYVDESSSNSSLFEEVQKPSDAVMPAVKVNEEEDVASDIERDTEEEQEENVNEQVSANEIVESGVATKPKDESPHPDERKDDFETGVNEETESLSPMLDNKDEERPLMESAKNDEDEVKTGDPAIQNHAESEEEKEMEPTDNQLSGADPAEPQEPENTTVTSEEVSEMAVDYDEPVEKSSVPEDVEQQEEVLPENEEGEASEEVQDDMNPPSNTEETDEAVNTLVSSMVSPHPVYTPQQSTPGESENPSSVEMCASVETNATDNDNFQCPSQNTPAGDAVVNPQKPIKEPLTPQQLPLSAPSTPTQVVAKHTLTPTSQDMSNLGVYTPDSCSNSVLSSHSSNGGSGYNSVEMDVAQLGLESPTSIGSNDIQQQHSVEPPQPTPTPQPYSDCAQIQINYRGGTPVPTPQHVQLQLQQVSQHQPAPNVVVSGENFPVNMPVMTMSSSLSAHMQTACGAAYYSVPHVAAVIQNHPHHSPQQVQQIQQAVHHHHNTAAGNQRLTHTPNSTCTIPSTAPPPGYYIQTSSGHHIATSNPRLHVPPTHPQTNQTGQNQTSCSLAKLQQLTNGIMEPCPSQLPSACTMTPPPNLTPPPSVNMTPPPSIQRNLTPPIPNLQSQVSLAANSHYYKQYGSQRTRQVQRSPNVTINANLMAQYQTLQNSYRMQQPSAVLNPPRYAITNAPGFMNQAQIQSAAQIQMNMMNMHPQTQYAHHQDPTGLQPGARPPQNPTMYTTYGYINGGIPPQALNSVMRR